MGHCQLRCMERGRTDMRITNLLILVFLMSAFAIGVAMQDVDRSIIKRKKGLANGKNEE